MPKATASKTEVNSKTTRGKRTVTAKKEPDSSVLRGVEKMSVKDMVAMKEGMIGTTLCYKYLDY